MPYLSPDDLAAVRERVSTARERLSLATQLHNARHGDALRDALRGVNHLAVAVETIADALDITHERQPGAETFPPEREKARAWDVLMGMWDDPDNADDLNGGDVVQAIGDLRRAIGYQETDDAADPRAPIGWTVTLDDGRRGVVQRVTHVVEWGEDAWTVHVDDGPTFDVPASRCQISRAARTQ